MVYSVLTTDTTVLFYMELFSLNMKPKLLHRFQSKQLSIEERIAAGKKLRNKFPCNKQGVYKPAANRTDPVLILEEQEKTRLPDLVPIRYARMLTSSFAFLRGAGGNYGGGPWALALLCKLGDAAMISGYTGNSNELDKAWFALLLLIKLKKALAAAAKSGRIKVAGGIINKITY